MGDPASVSRIYGLHMHKLLQIMHHCTADWTHRLHTTISCFVFRLQPENRRYVCQLIRMY